jgi:hypothetical protein
MRYKSNAVFLSLQAVALAAGNYVGWSTIFREVNTFCNARGGSLWSLKDFTGTATTNPLISPCFWGSIVFLLALAWTINLLMEKSAKKVKSQLRKMWWLLLGGTLFALVNNIPIIYKFYTHPIGSVASCSAGVVTNPYLTSCFLGFSAFLLAFVFATLAKRAAS